MGDLSGDGDAFGLVVSGSKFSQFSSAEVVGFWVTTGLMGLVVSTNALCGERFGVAASARIKCTEY